MWEVVENYVNPITLPSNPKLMQLQKFEEYLAKKPKTLIYIHSVVSDTVFTSIMISESPKKAYDI